MSDEASRKAIESWLEEAYNLDDNSDVLQYSFQEIVENMRKAPVPVPASVAASVLIPSLPLDLSIYSDEQIGRMRRGEEPGEPEWKGGRPKS